MKTSVKTDFAQIFSCCPKKMGARKFGAAPPSSPPARTPPLTKLKSNYVVLTF